MSLSYHPTEKGSSEGHQTRRLHPTAAQLRQPPLQPGSIWGRTVAGHCRRHKHPLAHSPIVKSCSPRAATATAVEAAASHHRHPPARLGGRLRVGYAAAATERRSELHTPAAAPGAAVTRSHRRPPSRPPTLPAGESARGAPGTEQGRAPGTGSRRRRVGESAPPRGGQAGTTAPRRSGPGGAGSGPQNAGSTTPVPAHHARAPNSQEREAPPPPSP